MNRPVRSCGAVCISILLVVVLTSGVGGCGAQVIVGQGGPGARGDAGAGAGSPAGWHSPVRNAPIDKIDLLFDIDNSDSMGDKQVYLEKAVPDLLNRLINPNCVDSSGA